MYSNPTVYRRDLYKSLCPHYEMEISTAHDLLLQATLIAIVKKNLKKKVLYLFILHKSQMCLFLQEDEENIKKI